MNWEKRGLIYKPPFDGSWQDNTALTPTPVPMNDGSIRVYAGFRDKKGVSRIGYVDIDATNPEKIIRVSQKPVLDIGEPGMFDDNGVILGDIIFADGKMFMYYVGFQLVKNVKFLAYSGLAISNDEGETFQRYSSVPVLDRSSDAKYINAIHSVIYEYDKIRVWYVVGNEWEMINNRPYPKYEISYCESDSLYSFPEKGTRCITNNIKNREYRIGRPRVYRLIDKYLMFFTYGTIDGRYITGMATSDDGFGWERCDDKIGIGLSSDGWDSKHLCYPALFKVKDRTYMVYNGNDMGYHGFGLAELIDDAL